MRKPSKMETQDASLPVSSLRLLAPPLRLVSAAMWKVMLRRDVMHYGRLEEFVTSVSETVPGLLSYRHQLKLAVGIRARLILELCRGPEPPDPRVILPHLDRIRALAQSTSSRPEKYKKVDTAVETFHTLVQTLLRDPTERERFFQEEFPVLYGAEAEYEKALEKLLWEFLTRLDQLLPVPDLAQTVSWLSAAPAVLEECARSASQPQLLEALLRHERCLGSLQSAASIPPSTGDSILSSLSLPPSGRVQQTSQSGSNPTPDRVPRLVAEPPKANHRATRKATAPVRPVIGLISSKDLPAMASANKKARNCPTPTSHLTWEGEAEPLTQVSNYTRVKQRSVSRLKERVQVAEEEEEPEEEVRVLRKVSVRRGRRGQRNQEKEVEGDGGMEREMRDGKGEGTSQEGNSGVKLQEGEGPFPAVTSCLNRQLSVVLSRLDVTDVTLPAHNCKQAVKEAEGDGGMEREMDGETREGTSREWNSGVKLQEGEGPFLAVTSCLNRQLRVVLPRLDIADITLPAHNCKQAVISPWKPDTEAVSERRRASAATRKRKRSSCILWPEQEQPSSDEKENCSGFSCYSPVRSPWKDGSGKIYSAGQSSDDIILDSEDETTKKLNGRLFLKRYYKTKHTYVPTLWEFWKPSLA